MGFQEIKRGKQKEKNLIKKLTLILSFTLVSAFIFNEIQNRLYRSQLSLLKFGQSEIKDFLIIGKGKDRFIVRGFKLIDYRDYIDIDNLILSLVRKEDIINVKSGEARYFKNNSILSLKRDVTLSSKDFVLNTPSVNIFLKREIAKNKDHVTIKTEYFLTTGKNLLIDFKNDKLQIENVKSFIRGI